MRADGPFKNLKIIYGLISVDFFPFKVERLKVGCFQTSLILIVYKKTDIKTVFENFAQTWKIPTVFLPVGWDSLCNLSRCISVGRDFSADPHEISVCSGVLSFSIDFFNIHLVPAHFETDIKTIGLSVYFETVNS